MTEATQTVEQPLSALLSALDACKADRSIVAEEARSEYVADLEKQLAAIMPTEFADLLALAGRLKDDTLAADTRARVAANLGRMAPLVASRQARMETWLKGMASGFDGCFSAQAGSAGCMTKASEILAVARTALLSAGGSDGAAVGIGHVLDAVASEITAAQALLEMAGTHIGQPRELLRELIAEEHREAALFCEALGCTAH